jgi:hypothetical protein
LAQCLRCAEELHQRRVGDPLALAQASERMVGTLDQALSISKLLSADGRTRRKAGLDKSYRGFTSKPLKY